MTDKQVIEYKHTKCTKEDCCLYCGSIYCGYVDDIENLEKAYKAKEQECEELKKQVDITQMFLDACNNSCEHYKQTLIEIKEIIKQGVKIHDDIIVSKQILQKISEVENDRQTDSD